MTAFVRTINGTRRIDDLIDIQKYTIPNFTQIVYELQNQTDEDNIMQWIIPDNSIIEIEIIGDDY